MQAAAIFTPYFRQKRNIFYFFGILNAEKRKNRKNMEGNWILKIYINNKSTANIETTIQRWKHVRRKGNHYVGNYIKKPKKEIAKLRRLGIKYDCYRVEYERANNYRQTFFSRTSGPYTCRYCNKKLSKTQVYSTFWNVKAFGAYIVLYAVSFMLMNSHVILSLIIGIAMFVINLLLQHRISKAFGKGWGYAVGLTLLYPIVGIVLFNGNNLTKND